MTEAELDPNPPIPGPKVFGPVSLRGRPWPVHPLVAGAALVVVVAAALATGAALAGRGASSGVATVVVPPSQGVAGATNAAGGAAGAADATSAGAAPVPAAAQAGVASSAAALAPSFIGPPCASAPTIQFQGRGLAATGIAPITTTGAPISTLYVSVQERGADAATVIASVQAKVQAISAALAQAGVPLSAILPSSFSSFGDPQGRQFTAYASVQAQVTAGDQLAQATKAVLQVPGVSGYSTSSGLAAQPTASEVQSAVGAAAAQARDMAAATARSVGVKLGDAQSVATQPPSVCYGLGGPVRMMQVTVTYAIR
jgi:hypothetical protein